MVKCDRFVLSAFLDGGNIRWTLSTDLPAGTRLIVDVCRHYHDTKGQPCKWTLWNDAVIVSNDLSHVGGSAAGTVNVDEGDRRGLIRFNELIGPQTAGTDEPLNSTVHVKATVGARQPLKSFGKDNSNLSGNAVTLKGAINIVCSATTVEAEIRTVNRPRLSS